MLIEVSTASQTGGKTGQGRELPAPEIAHSIAVFTVPFGPQGREASYLVAVGADIPRLSDEFDLADHRILVDQVKESRGVGDLVKLACQCRCQVEAEAVDMHVSDPVTQRIHDEHQDRDRGHEQGIACAGGVEVMPQIIGNEAIVLRVIEALE